VAEHSNVCLSRLISGAYVAEHCNVCLSRLMTHLEQTWQNIAMCVCLDSYLEQMWQNIAMCLSRLISGADVAEHCNVCLSRLIWSRCGRTLQWTSHMAAVLSTLCLSSTNNCFTSGRSRCVALNLAVWLVIAALYALTKLLFTVSS